MDWILIVFTKKIASRFAKQSFSRIDVCIECFVEGKRTGVISFSFVPVIVYETNSKIACAFPIDGTTTITFYNLRSFEPMKFPISNTALKMIVEACN